MKKKQLCLIIYNPYQLVETSNDKAAFGEFTTFAFKKVTSNNIPVTRALVF